jgi:hypothetical protein
MEVAPAGPPPRRPNAAKALQQARMHLGGLLKLADQDPATLCETEGDREKWTAAGALVTAVLAVAPPAAG